MFFYCCFLAFFLLFIPKQLFLCNSPKTLERRFSGKLSSSRKILHKWPDCFGWKALRIGKTLKNHAGGAVEIDGRN